MHLFSKMHFTVHGFCWCELFSYSIEGFRKIFFSHPRLIYRERERQRKLLQKNLTDEQLFRMYMAEKSALLGLREKDAEPLASDDFLSASSHHFHIGASTVLSTQHEQHVLKALAHEHSAKLIEQETYENKARSQRQERKRLIREVFNRRVDDFNSKEEFENLTPEKKAEWNFV